MRDLLELPLQGIEECVTLCGIIGLLCLLD